MPRKLSFPVFAFATTCLLAGCATAPAATPQEQALAERLGGKSLLPADSAMLTAVANADPFSQLDFWQGEFDKNPTNVAIGAELARSYQRLGRHRDAIATCNTLLSLNPDHQGTLRILAGSLIADNRAAAAEQPLQRVLSTDPDDASARSLLGIVHDMAGRHEDARVEYRAALSADPNHREAMVNLAMSFLLDGKPAFAETVLRESVQRPGATAKTRQNLALALALQGKYDEARSVALQDLRPGDAEASIDSIRRMIEANDGWKTSVTVDKPAPTREQASELANRLLRG